MKFSIALTTYQSEKYLGVQLESLLSQSLAPFELVVCDDGSTDGTFKILESFAARASFPVRVFRNEKNLGFSQNFAKAISLCEGDWTLLCDHDDRWHPEKLAAFASRINADPELASLFSDSALVDSGLNPLGTTLFESNRFHIFEQKFIKDGEAWKTFLRHNVVAGHALGFRTRLKSQILPIPEGWIHDAWIGAMLARLGKMDFIAEPLVDYRQHQQQQIGLISGGLRARLKARWARLGNRSALAQEAGNLKQLANRPEWQSSANIRDELKRKIQWLENRAGLPQRKLLRIPFLVKSLPLYFKFDNGWQTIVKDLLLG